MRQQIIGGVRDVELPARQLILWQGGNGVVVLGLEGLGHPLDTIALDANGLRLLDVWVHQALQRLAEAR